MTVRLQKFLAQCGVASRRKAEELIQEGRVCVNGVPATVGESIDPDTDTVTLDGATVTLSRHVYAVLNKPPGVITTASDTHGRNTVMDCLAGIEARVFPVGRLDLDVGGTLLLTNDGELAHRLTHPSYQIPKTYVAWVEGHMTHETAQRLSRGVMLEDGKTGPAEITILKQTPNATRIRLVLREGRKREVKRMCQAVGHAVRKLTRICMAGIASNDLRPGQWRYLTPEEVATLKKMVGLN